MRRSHAYTMNTHIVFKKTGAPAALVCVAFALALIAPHAAVAESISDSVRAALASHPAITAQKAMVDAAKDNVRAQKSNFYPVLSVDAAAGRLNEDDDTTRGNTGSTASSWKGQGSVTLTQPIFAGFGNVNRVAAAKDRQQSAMYDMAGSAQDVAMKAARAHLNLMRTRELLTLADDYMNNIKTRKDSISLMVKEGAADESDLLQAQDILMAARSTRLGYEEAFRQARADYLEAVGEEPANVLDIGAATWKNLIPATQEDAVAHAAQNPVVLSAQEQVQALAKDAAVQKAGLYPQVNAEMSYFNMDQHEQLGGEQKTAQAMLKMSWDFETGGGQMASVDGKLAERRAAEAKRMQALRVAQHDVRQKYTAMTVVDEQYALLSDRAQGGEKLLKSYLDQFEGGRQTNLQIISANARLFDARAAKTDAYYRRLLSRFELLQSMGQLNRAFGISSAAHTATAQAR